MLIVPSCRALLRLALEAYKTGEVDVRREVARTSWKLAQLLSEVGFEEESQDLKLRAQELRRDILGQAWTEDDTEEAYNKLVAYFYW